MITEDLVFSVAMTRDFQKLQELRLVAERITLLDSRNHMLKHELFNLKKLSLAFNHIEEINGLDYLKSLRVLDLQGNRITKMDKLNLPSLQKLYLSGNKIRKIENLRNCKKLNELDLSNNKIYDPNLRGSGTAMLEVIELNLSGNRIKKVKPFFGFPNVSYFHEVLSDYRLKTLTCQRTQFLRSTRMPSLSSRTCIS